MSDLADLFFYKMLRTANDIYAYINGANDEQDAVTEGLSSGLSTAELDITTIKATIKSIETDIYSSAGKLLVPAGPKFIMHRGLSARAPENTLPAFELAGRGGAWGIETDIFETTDGKFVCFHDSTVDRMTDGTGNIADMSLAEVQALTIDAGNNISQYPNLGIPLMIDYLKVCRRYGSVPVVEIKGVNHYDTFIKEIREFGILDSCLFLTGAGGPVINAIRQYTNAAIAMLTYSSSDHSSIINNLKNYKNVWVDLDSSNINETLVKLAHGFNIPVAMWSTDVVATAEDLLDLGVDAITSNVLTKLPEAVTVSGSTPVILAEPDTRYICGEVSTLSFTPSASGLCDVRFTSGSSATVLTLPNTVKLPDTFDPTALEINTVYEINVLDGVYGTVMSWSA